MVFEREPKINRSVGENPGGGLEVEFEIREIPTPDDKDNGEDNQSHQSEGDERSVNPENTRREQGQGSSQKCCAARS